MNVGPVTVGKDDFSATTTSFETTNTTAEPVQSLRVGIICLDSVGRSSAKLPSAEWPRPGRHIRPDRQRDPAKCEA